MKVGPAFRVFETLNDRGMDLSAVDLVKNYLFGLAHDEFALCPRSDRAPLVSANSDVAQDLKDTDFLKVFWTSRYGRTQLEQIFDDVKKFHRTSEKAHNLSIDLLETAEQYAALDDPDDLVWSRYSPFSRELISTLRQLGSKQYRLGVLSAIKRLDPSEFERLLRLLEVIIVRWQLIGGERTGSLEIQLAPPCPN